jgi:hypothetical protein
MSAGRKLTPREAGILRDNVIYGPKESGGGGGGSGKKGGICGLLFLGFILAPWLLDLLLAGARASG